MTHRLPFVALVAATALGFLISDLGPGTAQAWAGEIQLAQNKRPGLFERLFGKIKPKATAKKRSSSQTRTSTRSSSSSSRTTRKKSRQAPSVPTVEVVEKDPNALKLLVVGDYVAGGLAWGLDQALAKETKLAVVDRSNGSSGLVRADHYDWNAELLGILNEENPDFVIFATGSNDGQPFPLIDASVGGEAWDAAYSARIAGIVDTLKVYGRPFFWVSAPPMRGSSATSEMVHFNALYQPSVESAGGYFVDIWNGFTNANGQYIATGPDIEGKMRSLRSSDGINFTRAGKLKLAYYVEREIRRRTGIGAGTVDLLASTTPASQIEIGPDGKKRLVGPVLSLLDPPPGAPGRLAGEPIRFDPVTGRNLSIFSTPQIESEEETAVHELVVKGEALASTAGRVDDFTWPPSTRAAQAFVDPDFVDVLNDPQANDAGTRAELRPPERPTQ